MLSFSIGPFILSPARLAFAIAFAVALLIGWLVGRRAKVSVEPVLTTMLLAGIGFARLAFVAIYPTEYLRQPWRIIDIRDGGFIFAAGVAAALIISLYYAWKFPFQRIPLGAAVLSSLLVWGAGTAIFRALAPPPAVIAVLPLKSLQNESFTYTPMGKPVVANLWATWCPPCRREMPVLADAQTREKNIDFIFVNQGELAETVQTYLGQQEFQLENIYLDEQGEWASKLGVAGMPTTLFFDKDGKLIGSHTGELSQESLTHAIRRYFH